MKIRNLIISLLVVILLIAAGWAYWYFLMGPDKTPPIDATPGTSTRPEFQPLDRPGTTGGTGTPTPGLTTPPITTQPGTTPGVIPALRLLSDTPVGGYSASTTASTTRVRWADRGRGNIYEASYDSGIITTLSNTVVPKIFRSVWNKNLTAFIASLYEDGDLVPTTVYTDIVKSKSPIASSTAPLAPFELKGKTISGTVIDYAASPDRSKVIILMNEGGSGVGYVSAFNASNPVRLFTTPLVDINVSWPADDVIAVTTKASSRYGGFLYFVNTKTGVWSKVLGPLPGLTTTVNRTGKYVLYSSTGANSDVRTAIYSVAAGTSTDAVVRTLSDKCVWGNFYKELVYCGVPSQLPQGIYPDDWHLGTLSTVDKVWQVNASTGEVKLISSLIDQSDRVLNVSEPGLDPKDRYLFFVNKNDLSLWSLDLVKPK